MIPRDREMRTAREEKLANDRFSSERSLVAIVKFHFCEEVMSGMCEGREKKVRRLNFRAREAKVVTIF